jgi:hypothetical protein
VRTSFGRAEIFLWLTSYRIGLVGEHNVGKGTSTRSLTLLWEPAGGQYGAYERYVAMGDEL